MIFYLIGFGRTYRKFFVSVEQTLEVLQRELWLVIQHGRQHSVTTNVDSGGKQKRLFFKVFYNTSEQTMLLRQREISTDFKYHNK